MPLRDFLSLPHELRQMVYRHYFSEDEGYVFQPTSGKLSVANGKPPDLALMYTCRFIADETKHLRFVYNCITFETFYDRKMRPWAARFDWILQAQIRQQINLIRLLGRFFTPEKLTQIEQRFPWFISELTSVIGLDELRWYAVDLRKERAWPLSRSLSTRMRPFSDACGASALREAIEFSLRLVAKTPDSDQSFTKLVAKGLPQWDHSGGRRLLHFVGRCYQLWDVPTFSDLRETTWRFKDGYLWDSVGDWSHNEHHKYNYLPKFRFSAVSTAVQYLGGLPVYKRMSIRNIAIREAHLAVGHQDRHAAGLIQFGKENSRLRVSHQVSMVDVLFAKSTLCESRYFDELEDCVQAKKAQVPADLGMREIHHNVEAWLTEAVYLPKAGMPGRSYTLTLDCGRATSLCYAAFQDVVLRKEQVRTRLERLTSPNSEGLRRVFNGVDRQHADTFTHLINNTSFFKTTLNLVNLMTFEPIMGDELDANGIMAAYGTFKSTPPLRFDAVTEVPWLGRSFWRDNYAKYPDLPPVRD